MSPEDPRLSVGVDLGQTRDSTVMIAVRSYRGAPIKTATGRSRRPLHHDVVAIERLRVGLPYPQQTELIGAFCDRLAGRPSLFVDGTGVGRPVVEILRSGIRFGIAAVTIGGGTNVVAHGNDITVPKTELIGSLEAALSTRRLHCSPDLVHANELKGELAAFGYDLSPSGRLLYEGKGSHDDMVLGLALSVWGAERLATGAAGFMEYMRGQISQRAGEG